MYKLSVKAKQDLSNIVKYSTREFGVLQTDKYLSQLKKVLDTLAQFPFIGRDLSCLRANLYCYTIQSHTVFYQQRNSDIFVIRILHKRMDPQRYL